MNPLPLLLCLVSDYFFFFVFHFVLITPMFIPVPDTEPVQKSDTTTTPCGDIDAEKDREKKRESEAPAPVTQRPDSHDADSSKDEGKEKTTEKEQLPSPINSTSTGKVEDPTNIDLDNLESLLQAEQILKEAMVESCPPAPPSVEGHVLHEVDMGLLLSEPFLNHLIKESENCMAAGKNLS